MEVRTDPNGSKDLFVSAPEWDAEFHVYGACPVQGFGTVQGRELYFRARHGEWSFEVANSEGNLPTDGFKGGFVLFGTDPHYGYMPLPEAVDIIADGLRQYVAWSALRKS